MKVLVIADKNPHIDIPEIVNQQNIELAITLGDLTREDILGLGQLQTIPKIGVTGTTTAETICMSWGYGICI